MSDQTTAEKKQAEGKKDISIVDVDLVLYEKVAVKCKKLGFVINTLSRKIVEKGYQDFLDKDYDL